MFTFIAMKQSLVFSRKHSLYLATIKSYETQLLCKGSKNVGVIWRPLQEMAPLVAAWVAYMPRSGPVLKGAQVQFYHIVGAFFLFLCFDHQIYLTIFFKDILRVIFIFILISFFYHRISKMKNFL